jgi:hydrogenase maturation protein HypF
VTGVVQGVGFRPFVYRTARDLGLGGSVRNTSNGVEIMVEGPDEALGLFVRRLLATAPPRARIDSIVQDELPALGLGEFVIQTSLPGATMTLAPPDSAVCNACLGEMLDPGDRRYRYPFINCTDCGPRYTLIRDLPYDRARTSMASFRMCPECLAEYVDPGSRRFHAEPNACPVCGPRLWLAGADGKAGTDPDPLGAAVRLLAGGAILAVKGLGGFHLAVDACNQDAVGRLRRLKQRDRKPFAIMAASIQAIGRFAAVGPKEQALLEGPDRPIVLLAALDDNGLAPAVAPGDDRIGAMLPYTPLHHLLLADFSGPALVMTSANPLDEPIVRDNDEAIRRLAGIADGFLFHDRDIVARADDSVVMFAGGAARTIRRSRGRTPMPIGLAVSGPSVLAVGSDLKNAFVVTRGNQAFAGPHVGDLENAATADFFQEAVLHICRLLDVRPTVIAHDMHPDWVSTRLAQILAQGPLAGATLIPVQHHHAHVMACLGEHGHRGRAIGIVLDGTGYGTDGTIWGGEILLTGGPGRHGPGNSDRNVAGQGLDASHGFERLARLRPLPMPGGDAAVREPWRLAVAALVDAGRRDLVPLFAERWSGVRPDDTNTIADLCTRVAPFPLSSGAGRYFDAVAALSGACHVATFDGEAPASVERMARSATGEIPHLPWEVTEEPDGLLTLDLRPALATMADSLGSGAAPGLQCLAFHDTVVQAFAGTAAGMARDSCIRTIALSGGAFQNTILLEGMIRVLENRGMRVLAPSEIPANDGGLALGQALVALETFHGPLARQGDLT